MSPGLGNQYRCTSPRKSLRSLLRFPSGSWTPNPRYCRLPGQSEGPRLAEIAATALGDGAAAPLEAVDAIANGFAAAPTGAPVEANGHAAVPADADLRPQGPVGAKGEGYDAPHREAQQRPEPPVAEQHNFFSAGI